MTQGREKVYMLGLAADSPGSGKDTLFELLAQDEPRLVNVKFADQLTTEVLGMFTHLMPYEDLLEIRNDPKAKDTKVHAFALKNCRNTAYAKWVMEESGVGWEDRLSIRWHLLSYGTPFVREHLGKPDYWLDAGLKAARLAHSLGGIPVITDVRFPNEFAKIKRVGGTLIHIEAPWVTHVGDPDSIAEGHLKNMTFDGHILNHQDNPTTMKDQFNERFHF